MKFHAKLSMKNTFTKSRTDVHSIMQARRKQLQIGGAHINFFTDWGGGAHIIFFKMTDLCNEQYSIFVQIIGGGGTAPRAPPPPIPTALV